MLSVKGPPNLEKLSRHKPPKHLQGYWANLYIVASIFAPNYGTRLETLQDAANRNCIEVNSLQKIIWNLGFVDGALALIWQQM